MNEDSGSEQDKPPKEVKMESISLIDSVPEDDEEEDDQDDSKLEQHERVLKMCQKYLKAYPFSMFKKKFVNNLHEDRDTYRVRLYLLTAQNLTPTGVFLDVKSQLAGMTALSAANPYPVVTINDMKTGKEENDRDMFQELELSPQIHRVYEFGYITFPQEWKLEISIMDRAFLPIAD